MPAYKAIRADFPATNKNDGSTVHLVDKFVFITNPVNTDTIDFRVPAGLEVFDISLQCDDIDTNGTPTVVFSAGYTPVNAGSALAPSTQYFAATGRTTLQTGGRLVCSFKPIIFSEDVYMRITIGATCATFAAGEIHTIIGGNMKGVR